MVPIILLALAVLMTLAVARTLKDLGRRPPEFLDGKLDVEFSDPYPPLARAWSREDLDYLFGSDGTAPGMPARFQSKRRRLQTLFLRDLRRDFTRAWFVCRTLAPMCDDPDFAVDLVQQFFHFHQLYFRAQMRLVIGQYGHVDLHLGTLVDVLGQMRGIARELVQISQGPAAQPSSA